MRHNPRLGPAAHAVPGPAARHRVRLGAAALEVRTGLRAGRRLPLVPGARWHAGDLGLVTAGEPVTVCGSTPHAGWLDPAVLEVVPTPEGGARLPLVTGAGGAAVAVDGVAASSGALAVAVGSEVRVGDVLLVGVAAAAPPRPGGRDEQGPVVVHRPALAPAAPEPALLTPPPDEADPHTVTVPLAGLAAPVLTGLVLAAVAGGRAALLTLVGAATAVLTAVALRLSGARRRRRVRARRDQAAERFRHELAGARAADLLRLEAQAPAVGELVARAEARDPRLWHRRRGHPAAFTARAGDTSHRFRPALDGRPGPLARAVLAERTRAADMPAVVDLREPLAVTGPFGAARAVARTLVADLAVQQGPADVRVAVVAGASAADAWGWAARLPHAVATVGTRGPARAAAAGAPSPWPASLTDLVDRLDPVDTVDAAGPDDPAASGGGSRLVVVLDAPAASDADRASLRALLAGRFGPATAIVVAADGAAPAWCATVVRLVAAEGRPGAIRATVRGADGDEVELRPAGLDLAVAERLADALAPLVDPEAVTAETIPGAVGLAALVGLAGTHDDGGDDGVPAAVPDRSWNDVIRTRWAATAGTPECVVPLGVDRRGPVAVDLVRDGPHALVAGTTGSGKSELLRTLVASIAATCDPEHATFVLVDYKGGAAFDACARLPHVVGVVTDLDDGLAERALVCLEAEVRRRERQLRGTGATDLPAYRRARAADPSLEPLPRLFVVVDEFATLAAEIPSFVDALVDVAQRGRSLGVHLVLATQRPAGAVTDAMRTNVSLRVALRVVDAADSRDVIGTADAASLSRRTPGRALARFGPGELTLLQTARVTAEPGQSGELDRLVDAVRAVVDELAIAPPRRPWPDPLPTEIALAALSPEDRGRHADALGPIVAGLADLPHEQVRRPWRWQPASGHLLVAGRPGAGVSTTLATVALAAAGAAAPDRLHLYAFDGPGRPLAALGALAHTGAVVAPDDADRRRRLLHRLDRERARRAATGRGDGPSLLVLVDHVAGLRAELDDPLDPTLLDAFERLVTDGAPLGIHLVLGADRHGALGHRIDGCVAHRLTLHLPDADLPARPRSDRRPGEAPRVVAGRGRDEHGTLVQVAWPCAHGLDRAVAALHRAWGLPERAGAEPGSPAATTARPSTFAAPVGAMPEHVDARDHVAHARCDAAVWRLSLGVAELDLAPVVVSLHPGEHLLVAGPGRSGKSTVLAGIAIELASSLQAASDEPGQRSPSAPVLRVHVVAPPRSPLPRLLRDAFGVDDAVELMSSHDMSALALDPELDLDPALDLDSGLGPDANTPTLVLVDDADTYDDGGPLAAVLADAPAHVRIVAAGRPDRLRGLFRHWTGDVRRSRLGLLLRPDDTDGELLGVRLPVRLAPMRHPGRGVAVTEHGWQVVQAVAPPS